MIGRVAHIILLATCGTAGAGGRCGPLSSAAFFLAIAGSLARSLATSSFPLASRLSRLERVPFSFYLAFTLGGDVSGNGAGGLRLGLPPSSSLYLSH